VDDWGEIRFCIACVDGACQVHFLVLCRVAELGVNEKDLNILSFWVFVIDWMSGGVDGKSPNFEFCDFSDYGLVQC
jgi:hypothetical protein